MFYIFNVNQGCAQHLEVTAALGTVRNLQQAIEEITHVPALEQVLLISGGEGLHPDRNVAFYQGCGTDSNPIFLFYKIPEGERLDVVPPEHGELTRMCQEMDKKIKVYEDASLSNSLMTRYIESARDSYKITDRAFQLCDRIFQEHQFLHQGWLALMSNFDDCRAQIDKRVERFFVHYEKMNAMKSKAQAVVQDFDAALDLMEKILIPSTLLAKSAQQEGGKTFDKECSLYEFVSAADPNSSLRDVVSGILDSISQMDDSAYKEVKMHLDAMSGKFSKSCWQEIGGINGRFQYLDRELMALKQRAAKMKEINSVVSQMGHNPGCSVKDVITKQRAKMTEAQQTLDYVYKTLKSFMASKEEVLNTIRERLSKLALKAYDRLHMLNNSVTVYEEKYNGLRQRLEIIRQVKESPIVYMMAVSETIRRSVLQQEFMMWFSKFMEKSQKLVREETTLRDSFTARLEHHFLKQLFPGLFDSFPAFAPTQSPSFDQDLPPVDVAYVSVLKQALPAYAYLLKVNKPFIYNRLAIGEVQPICGPATPISVRDDLFTGPASPAGPAVFAKHFPSTNWLSGEDNVDLSPSNAIFFVKTPTSQFGSSLDLEATESPSKPLNSFPHIDSSLPRQDGVLATDGRICPSPMSLPIKIISQRDPNVKHFEFRRVEQVSHKEVYEHLRDILAGLKSFSEALFLLKQLQNELKETLGEAFKEISESVQKSGEMNGKNLDAAVQTEELSEETSRLNYEEAIKKAKMEAEQECNVKYEEKLKEEIQKAKEQTENSCRVQFDIVLEAELKAAREEARRIYAEENEEKSKEELRKKKNEIEKDCEARFQTEVVAMMEQARVQLEVENMAKSRVFVEEELQKKNEELMSRLNAEFQKRLKSMEDASATKYQQGIENVKAEVEKECAMRYDQQLDEERLKVREKTETECARMFDKELLQEVENAKECMKTECMAKYAIKLKEELKKAKEETEKECVSQYKKKLQQEVEKAREAVEKICTESYEEKLRCELDKAREEVEKGCSVKHEEETQQQVEKAKEETKKKLSVQYEEELEKELEKSRKETEERLAAVEEKFGDMVKDYKLEVDQLRSRQERDEMAIFRFKKERAELLKAFTGREELAKDLLEIQQDSEFGADGNIENFTRALEKLNEAGKQAQAAPSEKTSEDRPALEKEYMNKMHLLMKGHEEKKASEIARMKSESESELRCKEYRIRELEQLVDLLQQKSTTTGSDSSAILPSGALSLPNMSAMQESVMEVSACAAGPSHSQDISCSDDLKEGAKVEREEDEERSEDDIAALAVNTRGVQTRLRIKDLRYMITVQDLRELSTVLIIFSEVHGAYILFCVNSTLYFVKESCLRRLGLKSDQPAAAPRKNWLLGVMTRMEFCQIRKTNNRYNLAIGTRFYRVEVEPLLIDSSVRRGNDD